MDIELLTMSISVLAVAISVCAAAPVRVKIFKPPKRTPREQLPPEVRKLIENVDELERRVKDLRGDICGSAWL
ncbi:Uncharacterised protein [Enterobacter hormaechei]|uniref:hypothetical protein n=1 Tax=Enterobacter hormaechei TaxID=158836 RepID=UPI00125AF643|nr:hypothetical protein [Enterobacter hormaechei]EMB6148278.1 hypothetical protein [Enterobacter asburiae]VAE39281.1 Uncharacterised protein [Enterobacter hormaechei]VAM23496.1 Uncharacterised protein [Enterobacter hormaechei]